jgi:RNA-directed DNA polymerase
VKEQAIENKPAAVAGTGKARLFPKQAGETPDRWSWVERSVWTERMLNRLAESQEQTVWFSLWDKVWNSDNLSQAMLEVILNGGSAGVDGQTTGQIKENWTKEQERLQGELRQDQYHPQPARRVWIPKPGTKEQRPLGVPVVRDRVVQAALRHVLEPIFERDFAEQSYGFRPGRSCLHALHRVEELLTKGYTWIVDVDLKSYFDTIPRKRLLAEIQKRIVDGKVLKLLESYLEAGVWETGKGWQPTEQGTPQGSVISPLLSNIYLNPLDHKMAQEGYEMVRYADDAVVCCRTETEAQKALAEIAVWTETAGLKLHPTKTRIVSAVGKGGFDFLGYHFERYQAGSGMKWPRDKSRKKLRDKLREKLRRGRSGSIADIIIEINPILKGWFGYFKFSVPSATRDADQWVRERIRQIVRRRHKRRGIVHGRERIEYPNRWFETQGFYSLEKAQAKWIQSPTGNHCLES